MPAKQYEWESHISDDVLNLSLLQLTEFPIKIKTSVPKMVKTLNLSNNLLTSLPPHICTIIHLQVLDLSKNKLKSLPQQIGDLVNLRRLDLYDNQLTCLPLSIYKLQKLKFLDVSSNPLTQALKSITGPCENSKECEDAARNIVSYFGVLNQQVANDVRENLQKPKLDTEAPAEPKQDKSKKKKKNKEKKIVEEISVQPPVTQVVVKRSSNNLWVKWLIVVIFVTLAVYFCSKSIDIDNLKVCVTRGQKCNQLFPVLLPPVGEKGAKEL